MNLFSFKVIQNKSPPLLFSEFKLRTETQKYGLRSYDDDSTVTEPFSALKFGDLTFKYFFTKFYNNFLIHSTNYSLEDFKRFIFSNLDILFSLFTYKFSKFDLTLDYFIHYKKRKNN